jgi:hypothetical protein
VRARIASALGALTLAATTTTIFGLASPANAVSAYSSDECSSADNSRCFALFYNSEGSYEWTSSCFIANKNIDNYDGYYAGDGIQVYYVFAQHDVVYNDLGFCEYGSGSGQPVKNDAAAGANTLTSSYRVFYNSYQAGPYQTFSPGSIADLGPTMKNENASGAIV